MFCGSVYVKETRKRRGRLIFREGPGGLLLEIWCLFIGRWVYKWERGGGGEMGRANNRYFTVDQMLIRIILNLNRFLLVK